MTEKKRITPYPLRIPPDLREALTKASKENSRSLHAEILHILSSYFDIEKQIIEGVENNDAHTKKLLKDTFLEMLKDLENEGKVIITKDLDG